MTSELLAALPFAVLSICLFVNLLQTENERSKLRDQLDESNKEASKWKELCEFRGIIKKGEPNE